MTPLFTVNFRREAYLQGVARARRRLLALGAWVAYFGVLAVLLGLYGLNYVSLSRRVHRIERQTARFQGAPGAAMQWNARQADFAQIEQFVLSPREWHDRLARLSDILPPNVKLTSIAVNPHNLSGAADRNKLVISGLLRPAPGQDRMQGVMRVVSTLHDDSLFASGYRNIKLASTRVSTAADGAAEFTIECR